MRAWTMTSALAFAVVAVCTLFPFRFSAPPESRRGWSALLIGIGPDGELDILENVILFVPVGFALGGYLARRRFTFAGALTAVALISLLCSYSIEVAQAYLPGRFSSLLDVTANTAGGSLGLLGYHRWHRAGPGSPAADVSDRSS